MTDTIIRVKNKKSQNKSKYILKKNKKIKISKLSLDTLEVNFVKIIFDKITKQDQNWKYDWDQLISH